MSQGYIGLFTDSPEACNGGSVAPGTEVTLAVINRIRGGIGDSNSDGDCDIGDYIEFVGCMESMDCDCLCPFDYDGDRAIDLRDFQGFQVAFGTGNTRWKAGD